MANVYVKALMLRVWILDAEKLTGETNGTLTIAATACRKGARAALQIAASTKEDLEKPTLGFRLQTKPKCHH